MGDFNDFIRSYGETDLQRTMEIVSPINEEVFIKRLYEEIDRIILEVESGPYERRDDEEDRLSVELVSCLKSAGYFSVKDPTQGGHIDILVQPKQKDLFKWYGEAKIWRGVEVLKGGMSQLLNRYATGRQANLGFLVYFKSSDFINKMESWRNCINALDSVDEDQTLIINQFSFSSVHAHATGANICVRHFSLNIHWNPTNVV